jgi:hypothetical protein
MVTSPVKMDLTHQPLQAMVDTTQAKDSDGYYYKAGDLVEIAGDGRVKKLTTTGRAFGVLLTSIHEDQAPDGLNDQHRVAVATKYRYLIEFTAEGTVAAGDDLVAGTVTAGTLKKASALDGSVDAGATTVTSTAANGDIITLSGSTLPEEILAKCWVGAIDGNKGQALI